MKNMKMPSVMRAEHRFSMVPRATIERSQFDRSHGHKTTFDEAYLIPIFVDEALPGDTFNLKVSGFIRMTTPIKPVMDNIYADTFFFAVPNRLVWSNWQKFNGEQVNPGDSTSFVIPTDSSSTGLNVGTFEDYAGVPTGVANLTWSALFARAYQLIYNQWFRDENLINSLSIGTGDSGSNVTTGTAVRKRGKRHDYFTSCLPWTQKGPVVNFPIGGTAPVIGSGTGTGDQIKFKGAAFTGARLEPGSNTTFPTPATTQLAQSSGSTTQGEPLFWAQTGLVTDLSSPTAATINSLRQAFQVQKMFERDARGGTRYTEILKAHFGVTSPDARLQRPEYLGGGTANIVISPIAQNQATGASGTTTPQGNLAAIATGSFSGHGFAKSFTEHCIVMGIVSVRSDITYQHGLERMWSRSTRYDFYWPALAHIGEQAVYNREIYAQGTADDALVFGYQERYAEYRYKPSRISGKFRSTAAGTLEIWHLSQKFTSLPVLNQTFIEEPVGSTAPLYRTLAVPTEPHFIGDFWFDYKCARPMPVYGVPGLIDHF